jgi:uncharacterized membrane-anchored protein
VAEVELRSASSARQDEPERIALQGAGRLSGSLRIKASLLDRLLDHLDQMAADRQEVARHCLAVSGSAAATVEATLRRMERGIARMRSEILAARLVPFDRIASRLSRAVEESARQAGRMVQRLLEIHTYCMTALLALPLAREIGPAVSRMERELSDIAQTLKAVADPDDEQAQLKRLSALAAEVESLAARTPYRFGAARAYHTLVARRIEELREQRIEGQQTIGEFMERRLAPAMRTCETLQRRLDSLSERVARASEMLRTRVDVTLAAQNRDLLASMDRRARLQLRLQRTVEGLSVAAITYYAVGLVSYLTQGLDAAGLPLPKEIVVAIAVPVLAGIAWLGLRQLHKKLDDR